MPATAAHQSAPDEEPCLASVVSLASRRREMADAVPPDPADSEEELLAAQAVQHWATVFEKVGLRLDGPEAAQVVPLITTELERLVGGLLVLREGRGEQLPPDPNAGVDITSAVEVTGILRDLARAVDATRLKQD